MEKILYYFFAMSGITAFAVFIGKLFITKSFDLGVEKYKAKLLKENEEHKSHLAKMSLEHEIKFSKLHQDRAEKIKTLYTLIIELEKSLIHSTTIFQGPEYINDTKRDDDAVSNLRELITQLDLERIFFSEESISKFDKIIKESWDIIFQMRKVRLMASTMNNLAISGQPIPEKYLSESDLWQNTYERTQTNFKLLKDDLANEFRKLLGI